MILSQSIDTLPKLHRRERDNNIGKSIATYLGGVTETNNLKTLGGVDHLFKSW